MRKLNNKIVAFVVATLALVSCSDDFTEVEPKGSVSYENFWNTEDDAKLAVNSLYNEMKASEMFSRGFFWYINASDDMITGRIKADADNIKNFVCTGDEGYTKYMYEAAFKVIRRANDILKNVPEMINLIVQL